MLSVTQHECMSKSFCGSALRRTGSSRFGITINISTVISQFSSLADQRGDLPGGKFIEDKDPRITDLEWYYVFRSAWCKKHSYGLILVSITRHQCIEVYGV